MSKEKDVELPNIEPVKETRSEDERLPRISRRSKGKILCGHAKLVLVIFVGVIGAALWHLHREYARDTSVFLILAIAFVLLFLYFAGSVVFFACFWAKDGGNTENSPRGGTKRTRFPVSPMACLERGWKIKNSIFDPSGKYFLAQRHLSQLLECFFHCYNFLSIYICSLPLPFSTALGIIIMVGGTVNAYASLVKRSLHCQNLLIIFDAVMDVFMVALPFLFRWYGIKVSTPTTEAVQIVLIPALGLFFKVKTVWSEIHRIDLERIERAVHGTVDGRVKRIGRNRHSIYRESKERRDALKAQNLVFRPCCRHTISAANVLATMFLFILIVFQLTAKVDDSRCQDIYSKEVWDGCEVKIPFCQSPFAPTCGCTVLKLANYSQRTFPPAVNEMSRLSNLYIYSGILEFIPDKLHATLYDMIVVDNHLATLPEKIGESKTLRVIDVSNNELEVLPESFVKMKELQLFAVNNNTLRKLPENIGEMDNVGFLDVRNNRLKSLPTSIAAMPRLYAMYASGNPVCHDYNPPQKLKIENDLCEQQCSDGCRSLFLGDGYCTLRYIIYNKKPHDFNVPAYQGCNVASCRYDNGDCPSS